MGRPLEFEALLSVKNFEAGIKKIEDQIKGITATTQQETQKMDNAFKNLATGIGAYFSVSALQGFTHQLIQVRGEFQKTEIAFGTMLKSKEKAKTLMGEMVDLAAKTPFGLQEVSDGAKRLLAFQVPANEVVDTLRRMGDVAAGLGVPMGQLIHVYGQVKAAGKLMTNDLYQFMNAGIPILAELGKVLGKSEAEIKKMVGEGKIGFTEIQQVIQNMTNEGGMFFNLMEAQSSSLSGQIANLEDAIDQMFNKIGESSEGFLSNGIQGITLLVENYDKVAVILSSLVATYGAYRAAVMATMVVENIRGRMLVQQTLAQGSLNTVQALGTVVTMNLQRAVALLNTTLLANPYALAIAGVVGLVAVLWNLDTATESVQDNLTKWANETKEIKSEAEGLINIVKSQTATYLEKADALEKLQKLAPETFANLTQEQVAAMDLTQVYKQLNEELERKEQGKKTQSLEQMKKELQELENLKFKFNVDDADGTISGKIQELKQGIAELEFADKKRAEALMAQNAPLEEQLEYWNEEERKINDVIDAIKRQYPELDITKAKAGQIAPEMAKMQTAIDGLNFGNLLERLRQVQSYARSVRNELSPTQIVPDKPMGDMNKNEVEAKIKALQEEKALLTKKEDIAKKQAEIDKLRVFSRKWDDTPLPSSKPKASKKPTKSQVNAPIKGSLGELEAELSAINTKLQNKTLITDAKTREKLLAEREKLEKRIAEIRKQYNKLSFDEELAETERQWKVRYMLAEKYGQEIAKAQFPDLKGESYLADIQSKFKPLDDKFTSGIKLTDEELDQWQKLKTIIDNLKGEKDPFTNWKDSLDEQLESVETYAEKIAILQDKMANLTDDQKGQGYEAELNQRLQNAQKEYQKFYNDFLKEQRSFEEKSTAIRKEFDALRQKAQEDLSNGKIDLPQYQEITLKINTEEARKQVDLFIDDLQNGTQWFDVFQNMEGAVTPRLQKIKELILAKLRETHDEASRAKLNEILLNINTQIDKNASVGESFNNIKNKVGEYVESKKQVKEAQEVYNNAVKNFGKNSAQAIAAETALNNAQQASVNKRQELANAISDFANKMSNHLKDAQDVVGAVKDGAEALGISLDNTFGDALEKIEGVIAGLSQATEGAMQFAKGMYTGNPLQMISGGIKAVTGVVKAIGSLFNDDKEKERQIQREKRALEGLKTAYEDLAHAAQKAFGERKYSSQTGLIQNLEQQKARLHNMISAENSKKNTDHDKIRDWQNQISAINRSIDDIKTNVIKDVLQTDVVDAAAKMGDALVDAFSRGESRALALKNVANNLIKDMLKNQLNLALQERLDKSLKDLMKATGLQSDGKGQFIGDRGKGGQDGIEEFREKLAIFKEEAKRAGEQMTYFLEDYKDIFQDLENPNTDSLKGSIKGMTEQTADVLAGQFNAIRINTGELVKNSGFSLEAMKNAVGHLVKIEQNTFNLHQMRKDLAELNSKVKGDGGIRASGL